MAGKADYSIEIIDHSRISASGVVSGDAAAIPLSFFDIKWLLCPFPMQRVIFYDIPGFSMSQFTEHALPTLRRTLSVVLERFFPLAGSLAFPPSRGKPFYCCDDHGVTFIAAVSEDANFVKLTSSCPQAAAQFRPLLPPLPTPVLKDDGTRILPLLGVQVTLFPNSGICIGLQCDHVAADGPGFGHFMKAWSTLCRAEIQGDDSRIDTSVPVFNRTVIKDPTGLESILLKQWREMGSPLEDNSPSLNPIPSLEVEKLRASFTLTKVQAERLRSWISGQIQDQPSLRISTYAATCAYVWVCFIKSKEAGETDIAKPDVYYFRVMVDCRERLGYPIPKTYMGNVLESCFVSVKRDDIVGQHGIVLAAKAIAAKIKELEAEGVLLGRADQWLSDTKEFTKKGCLITAAGSPRSRVYDVDFGWGRPRTSQVGHIDKTNGISLATARDEEGGIEVGLALAEVSMDAFCVMFEEGLSSLCA